jgi:hypothetical protein
MAVVFERGEGELELVLGEKVFDEGDDVLEGASSRIKITSGAQK